MSKPALWSCVDQETFQKMIEALESGDENAQAVAQHAKEIYLLVSAYNSIDPRDQRTYKQKAYDQGLDEEEKRLYDALMECPETLAFMEYMLAKHLRPTFLDGMILIGAIRTRNLAPHADAYQFPVWFPPKVFDELHRRSDTVELVMVLRVILSSMLRSKGTRSIRSTALDYRGKPEGFTVDDFDPVSTYWS